MKIRPTKFHDICGTFITNLLLQGVPVINVQAMVGHDDLKTTLMYIGMLAEETKGATGALTLQPINNVVNLTNSEKRRMPIKQKRDYDKIVTPFNLGQFKIK